MRKKFLRSKWRTYSKLGHGRKKKQKYRKARGRHNKVREGYKGNPVKVEIGYKKQKKVEGVKIIYNASGLEGLKKGENAILAKIGVKNKINILGKAKEKGINILNINPKKFLKKIEHIKNEKKARKKESEEKKKAKEKKAKTKKEETKDAKTEETQGDKK